LSSAYHDPDFDVQYNGFASKIKTGWHKRYYIKKLPPQKSRAGSPFEEGKCIRLQV
jgi:hypothetical protein